MRTLTLGISGLICFSICTAFAQPIPVTFTIDTSRDSVRISPYVYGTNGQSSDGDLNITARRIGGNRLTGYNWENNASNMGMDYDQSNSNDNYLTWAAGIGSAQENIPGIVLRAFHDTSLSLSCYSLITLPAAGYVSRDKAGSVPASQVAPSSRFREVKSVKGSPFTLAPDTSDAFVYVDEEVHFLTNRYGLASSASGVKGYAVDNEPALWPSTHPRIHPAQTMCAEIIRKNVEVARAVKSVDPGAELFGGVFYGFNAQYNMQQAPDWSSYQSYGRFVNAFLAKLRDSSTAAGMRLVDVLDLHWYPDLNHPVALNDNIDSATVAARVQAPRSLWDSTYVEDGWIGQWFSPVSLIPNIMGGIQRYNPGTKLAITEFNYGAPHHISGGVALADVLGIFGSRGVYLATHWGAVEDYLRSAYLMYRNYDGARSTFGDMSIHAVMSDALNSSVYAAVRAGSGSDLHIIAINKNQSRPIQGSFTISSPLQFRSLRAFTFDNTGPAIRTGPGGNVLTANTFAYTLAPLSVSHFVLSTAPLVVAGDRTLPVDLSLEQNYPNPFNPTTTITYSIRGGTGTIAGFEEEGFVSLRIYDVLGRCVATLVDEKEGAGPHTAVWNASQCASGVYYCRLSAGGSSRARMMVLLR